MNIFRQEAQVGARIVGARLDKAGMSNTLFDITVGGGSKHTHAVQYFGHCLRSGGSKSVLKINFRPLPLNKSEPTNQV